MNGYPLLLDVSHRRVLVVGGGPVAARRVQGLLAADADIHVVAPFACEDLWSLAQNGEITLQLREFQRTDIKGSWLVHTATGDRSIDQLVAHEANSSGVWCVRADDAARSAAWTPAVVRVADLTVSVNAGADPQRAVAVRNAISTQLRVGALPLRHHRASAGSVALVGGGPGDPGLITTRGRVLLAEADVVVVDRLAPQALLEELDEGVEVIDAGKAPHAHTLSQEQINHLLVERATRGQRVVRLKGGDPFVLGRGVEELEFCSAAGIQVEVVPGVSSATGVPAAAGIPVTQRGVTSSFTVVSGHDRPIDFDSLARLDGTLLFLMGVSRLADIAEGLVAAGRLDDEPIAIVERGTTPQQRVTVGTLSSIVQLAAARSINSPAVIVVGDVVRSRVAFSQS